MRRNAMNVKADVLLFCAVMSSCLQIAFLESAAGEERAPEEEKPVTIFVNVGVKTGTWNPALIANLGYDPIYKETLDDSLKQAWQQIKESEALFYARCHNIFSDSDWGCRVYSEDAAGNPRYDWSRADRVLDTFLNAGVRPIVECDFMPDALAEGEIVRNYSGGAINLPKDYGRWKELVRQLVLHCEKRYGQDEVRRWYFEPWNEPDVKLYWIGGGSPTKYEDIVRFFRLYDYFAAGAKEADPLVRIGGPALGGCNIDYNFARYFLIHCVRGENFATGKKEGSPIDFISWHAYGDLNYILDVNERYRRIIEDKAPSLAKCERHLTEWGQELGKGDNWPRTQNRYEAAFTCALLREVLDRSSGKLDLMLRWGGLTGAYFQGWRSLFTRVGDRTVPVAIFNLYRIFGKMAPSRVQLTINVDDRSAGAFATSDSPNTVQVLLWRFEEKNHESVGPERKFTVNIRGFQERIRAVEAWEYRIDGENCDGWSEWTRMRKPKPASAEQARAIYEKAILSVAGERRRVPVRQGRVIVPVELRGDSVCLLVLGREGNGRKERAAQPIPSAPSLPTTLLP
jgi:xylan 1,4-beta-xylosidase